MQVDKPEGKESTSEEQAQWVRRYQASGVGLKRFATQHGLRAARLHYWVYGKRRKGDGKRGLGAPRFQEVKMPGGWVGAAVWGAEIQLPDGTVVRLGAGTDAAWMASLLRELRGVC